MHELYTPVHTHMTHTYMDTHTHTHTHTHKHTHIHIHTHTDWACTTCSDIGSYFSQFSQSIHVHELYTPVHTHMTHTYMDTHTHTRTCTCTHTDWACTTCRYLGFLFLSLFSQIVHVHECSTHTHTHTHTHTDWACSDLWLLFLTLYSQSTYMCNNTPCIVM